MTKGEKIVQGYKALYNAKSTFQTSLEAIAYYALPDFERAEKTGDNGTPIRPVSSKPPLAAHTLGGNFYSNTVSTGQEWFSLRARSKQAESNDTMVKSWLYNTTQTVLRYIQNSNSSEALGSMFTLYGTFGTGVLETDYDRTKDELVFTNININENVFIAESDRGFVDTLYRELRLTAHQAGGLFGREVLPQTVLEALIDESRVAEKFKFIHAVYPNRNRDPERMDYAGMAYSSCYVFESEQKVVMESGYRTFPFSVPRFIKVKDFPYGYGAGHNALFAMRELNRTEAALIDAIEMASHPSLFVADEDAVDTIELRPNSINYVDMTQGPPKEYSVGAGNVGLLGERSQQLRYEIDQLFYNDVFQMIRQTANDRATATEIRALDEEKLASIGPMVTRLQAECFSTMIERCVDLLIFYGVIEPPPLEAADYRVVYTSRIDSKLSLVQNQMTISAAQNAAQLLALGAQVPEMGTVMNLTGAAAEILEKAHINPELIIDAQEREAILQAQRKQQEAANELEQYKAMVKPVDPSKPVAENSPLAAFDGLAQQGI